MTLSTQYGNIDGKTAWRMARAAGPLDDVEHEEGSTEPWISRLVADFVVARDAYEVLETGCFKGATSVYLADALLSLGGGHLTICDIDPTRLGATYHRVHSLLDRSGDGEVGIATAGDVIEFLSKTVTRFDLAWVDDCHEAKHVQQELTLLYPKMNQNGLILLHDIDGICNLRTVVQKWGGYSIELPRLGPSGGLGVIQVRP